MAEAFVKTFKRDDARVNPIPDAHTALLRIDHWMEQLRTSAFPPGLPLTAGVHASLKPAECPV
jgi:putative transposase